MKKLSFLLIVLLSILPIRAEAAVLRSYPAKGSRVKQGYFYSLPKTVITGTAKYNIYKVVKYSDEEKTNPVKRSYVVLFNDPITLEYPAIRDDRTNFRIDAKRLRSFTVATKSDVFLDDNNLITKVSADFDDQTGPMITSLVQTGANVAAMLAKAGIAATAEEKVKAIEYKDLGSYTQNFTFDIERDLTDEIAQEIYVIPDKDGKTFHTVDPTKIDISTVYSAGTRPKHVRISKSITDDSVVKNISDIIAKSGDIELKDKTMFLPRIMLSVTVDGSLFGTNSTSNQIENDFNDHWYSKIPIIGTNGYIPGVIVRSARNCKVDCYMSFYQLPISGPDDYLDSEDSAPDGKIQTVVALPFFLDKYQKTKQKILYSAQKPFLQFGDTSVIPISSGLFTHRVYRLEYSTAGHLKNVGIDSDSRGANIAKTLENSSKAALPIGELIGSLSAKPAAGSKTK